jgi:anti-sigma regulatory factor (Ser/Thr protein kinase)
VHTASVTVPSRAEFVRPATVFLVNSARALNVSAAQEPVFEVAISEAITNAVKHGGDGPHSHITCELELNDEALVVRIIDQGSGFVMRSVRMPEVSAERIESLPASGYGLPIIHTVFPVVRVVNLNDRFAVELALPAAAGGSAARARKTSP